LRSFVSKLLLSRAVIARFASTPPNQPLSRPPTQPLPVRATSQQDQQHHRGLLIGVIAAVVLLLLLACVALAPGIVGKVTAKSRPPSTSSSTTPTASSAQAVPATPTVSTLPAGLSAAYYNMPTVAPGQPVPSLPAGTPVFSTVDFTAGEANFPAVNGGFDIPSGVWGLHGAARYPHPELGGLGPHGFGVRWTGLIRAPQSAPYTFSALADDGVRVWVNGQLLVDNWTAHAAVLNCSAVAAPGTPTAGPSTHCTTIQLTAGQTYRFEVDYYENNLGGASLALSWQTPTMAHRQIVPDSALSHPA
jgi:hypothetical protein